MATWLEPLSAAASEIDGWTVAVTAVAGDGTPVASVLCAHNAAAGYGVLGEMRIVDDGGAPRQRQRALVLLVREALRSAALDASAAAGNFTGGAPGAADAQL